MTHRQFRATVRGRVQGVYFRASTVEKARSLGLTGSARNRSDGAVEVIARGEPDALDALDALLAYLHEGPPAAEVTSVEVDWNDSSEVGSDFRVVY